MIYIPDEIIDRFIKEDVPYIDLTTLVMGIGGQPGKMEFFCRENAVLCGTEEVLRVFERLNIKKIDSKPSGTLLEPGEVFLRAEGKAEALHMAWKVSLNILEYCSGIATRTKKLVDLAGSVNPGITVVTTRKTFPGTKELAVKSVLAGGGFPHRLGLSETVLIFKQHLNFGGSLDDFIGTLNRVKSQACEKKIIVETENLEDALKLCRGGVDGIQFDKVPVSELKTYIERIRNSYPGVTLLAAGGINEKNIVEYARTGVNAIVTTSVYFGRPVDMSVRIEKT
ncbi:ModD protein [Desulfolucanica intricata]|uniref:ModD protein n=1 Tax=Desulfolucanica intricata TaxID=1285191 RepID=UPI000A8AA610|nr:ModD protein [Desulfolucanica intricata]